jgi:hypothetical protein
VGFGQPTAVRELLQQFKAVEQFNDDDKTVVKKLIDAFIVKKKLQLMAS